MDGFHQTTLPFILPINEQIDKGFFAGTQVLSCAKSWVVRNVTRKRAGAGEPKQRSAWVIAGVVIALGLGLHNMLQTA